ncbi:serine/threonine-protein kinase [Isosphaeraceae bacterium EP7]
MSEANRPAPPVARWSGSAARRFLRLCAGMNNLVEEGGPDVVAFLDSEPGLPAEEAVAVLRADQRRRIRAGRPAPAEWYFERFPGLLSDPERALDLIFSEYLLRESAGERPEVRDYLVRFPRLSGRISLQAEFHLALGPVEAIATEEDDPPPAQAGAPHNLPSFPGYEILRQLGVGGMGVVYEAYQVGLKRRVALKMVLAGQGDAPERAARFQKEAEAAARLHHPNIAEIHEIGEFEGRPYFTLELVEGGDLAGELARGLMAPRRAAQLTESLARAMHYAHERGIIHRDLKPSNILLTPEGLPKVADFGLAKHLGGDPGQTRSGTVLGSPGYMAPEQASGKVREVGREADVYSLGAILYEMLTGAPPFHAESAMEALSMLLSEDPVRPRRLKPKVSRDLETICLKCLERNPRRRYPTAGDLADDLGRFLDHDPIRARPIAPPERIWRWCRRRTSLAFAAGLAAVAVASTIGLAISLGVHQYRAAGRIEEASIEVRARRRQVDQMAAQLAYDHGQALAERGDVAHGLLWLARGLAGAEHVGDAALEQATRRNLAGWWGRIHPLRLRWAHPGPIQSVAYSPDGKLAATASEDRTVRIWQAATGEPAGPALEHPSGVRSVAFSPDGKTLLTGCDDSSARVWDLATGRRVGPPLAHESSILSVALSPDGKTALTGGTDGTARLWDISTGRPLLEPFRHQERVAAVAFSPDGRAILTTSWDRTARLWDAATGVQLGQTMAHDGWVCAAAFSPDGRTVLTGCYDHTARLWDRETGLPLRPSILHQHCVASVAFSPDGRRLATGSIDGTARVWDAATGEPVGPLLRHQHTVSSVAFAPDGRSLMTGGFDGEARVWEVGRAAGRAFLHAGFIRAVTFSPDGRRILSASQDHTARLWDAATGEPIGPPMHHDDAVESIAFSPDGRSVLTGSLDATAQLWDAATLTALGPPLRHGAGVRSVAFSPDGRTALTGSDDRTARLWDAATGLPIGRPLSHGDAVRSVAFSPDGRTALTGSDDRTARLWDAATGLPRLRPLAHRGRVITVVFSPNGRAVLTGSDDSEARLWDAETGTLLVGPLHHGGPVSVATFSPDGLSAITGGWDRTARLWDVATGRPIARPLRHDGQLRALAISPDGRTVLTGSYDRTAQLWDQSTGRPIGPSFRHESQVWFVAFAPGGRSVLSGGEEYAAHLWDVPAVINTPTPSLGRSIRVATGMELRDDGSLHMLSLEEWDDLMRRQARDKDRYFLP